METRNGLEGIRRDLCRWKKTQEAWLAWPGSGHWAVWRAGQPGQAPEELLSGQGGCSQEFSLKLLVPESCNCT